ncbi:MAG: lysylphosphatidylglycerol synthase transmembrane domain-containing protein [Candidatus Bathyarchaeia archaeon]|nr:lysylphosphatidylglycerol synthase transmembrane domain-containing protein [Candidatus Bathyarchaeia archaeon]
MTFKASWKTFFLLALGLAAFFIYLYLFNVDIPTIIATAQRVDLSIYSAAVVFLILDTFFYSLSWYLLLNFLSVKLSVAKSFLYVWYGTFVDIAIPAESLSADVTKVYLVTREHNGTSGKVVASLVIQRLMGMGINIVGLLLGIILLLMERPISGLVLNLSLFLTGMSTLFLILLIFLCFREKWTLKLIDAVIKFLNYVSRGRWKLTRVRGEVVKAAKMFHDSIKVFGHAPKILFASFSFGIFSWFLSVGIAYLVFFSMKEVFLSMNVEFPVPWSVIISTHSIVSAIHGIPLGIPFEAGLPEITMTTIYVLTGIPFDISATATILTRILSVWLRFFIGFAVQQALEIKAITANNKADKTLFERIS